MKRFLIALLAAALAPAAARAADVVVDDDQARLTGSWESVSPTGCYGGTALRARPGSGGATAVYQPALDRDGIYRISLWLPVGDESLSAAMPVFIRAADRLRNTRVDLRGSAVGWRVLGEYHLPSGRGASVVVTDLGEGLSIVDAVRFAWAGPAPPPGRTFYVAPRGNDAGPGSLDLPWATVRKAAEAMGPGDTVYVGAGVYDGAIAPARSGAAHSYIRFRAVPGETPVLRGKGRNGFNLTGRSWIRIEGFRVEGFSDNGVLAGPGARNIELSGCEFSNNGGGNPWTAGFMALSNTGEIGVTGCVSHDNSGFGFASDGEPPAQYLTLVSCESYRNGNDGFGFYADRAYLRGCVSHENGGNLSDNGDDFDFVHSGDTIIERCEAWGSKAHPYKFGYGYNVVSNCISADTQAEGYGRYSGITFLAEARGRVYNCSTRGIYLAGDGPYTVKNNIIRKNGSVSAISAALFCARPSVSLRSDYNLFLPDVRYGIRFDPLVHVGPETGGRDFQSLAAWKAAGQDAHSAAVSASPYVNEGVPALDFRLSEGSVAIDAGTGEGAPAADFFGYGRWDDPSVPNRGDGVDLGACEYRKGQVLPLSFEPGAQSAAPGDVLPVFWFFHGARRRVDAYFGVRMPDGKLAAMDGAGRFQSRIVPVAARVDATADRGGVLWVRDMSWQSEGQSTFMAVCVPAGGLVTRERSWIGGKIASRLVTVD